MMNNKQKMMSKKRAAVQILGWILILFGGMFFILAAVILGSVNGMVTWGIVTVAGIIIAALAREKKKKEEKEKTISGGIGNNKKKKARQAVGGTVLAIGLIMLVGVGAAYTTYLVVTDSRELKTTLMPNPRFPGQTYSWWDKQTPVDAIMNMSGWIIAGSILTMAGMIILHDGRVVYGVGLTFVITAVLLGLTSIIYLLYLVNTDNDTEAVLQLFIISFIWLFIGFVVKSAGGGGEDKKK